MSFNITRNIGFLLLAVYLILQGLGILFIQLTLPPLLFAILAIVAGVFILIGR